MMKKTQQNILLFVVTFACLLAFTVVILGAYTRLSNAGLGCPDWPGCYGHILVPEKIEQLKQVEKTFPGQIVETAKAWKEMIHRYAAGILGIVILLIAGLSFLFRKKLNVGMRLPLTLCLLLVLQATLGMLTVTLKLLPLVVMGHLLGGLAILSVLWCLRWNIIHASASFKIKRFSSLTLLSLLGVIFIAMQLALGGWVSTNYAGLSCVGFPYCNGQIIPHDHLQEAFNFLSPIGANYEGGVLNGVTRATIQMVHRLWAYWIAIYLIGLSVLIFSVKSYRGLRRNMLLIMIVLTIQIIWGILNVAWMLPLWVAVMHNATAALLFLAMLTLTLKSRTI